MRTLQQRTKYLRKQGNCRLLKGVRPTARLARNSGAKHV
jgi:hypothetical protein